MGSTLVSIVTPVYNAEKFLRQNIESVLSQSYTNFEMLLVDDCSTDNSRSILDEYAEKDNRIKPIFLSKNGGAAVARNAALKKATGRFIAFLDSDDLWRPEKLKKQMEFMNSNKFGFTYTRYERIREDDTVIHDAAKLPMKLNYNSLLKNTAIATSTVIIDKGMVGEFDIVNVRRGQDTATWLKLLKEKIEFAHLCDDILGYYRDTEGSLSDDKLIALKRTWNTYRNIEKLPLPKAIFYFISYTFNAVKRRI